MNIHKLSILFVLKKNKSRNNGTAPIQCRLTYNQKRKQFATGQFINPDYWKSTARKTSIPSTFDEHICESMIGMQLPGDVERIECEEYEYVNKETGEVITLHHTYNYVPEEKKQAEKSVFQPAFAPFSMNGQSVFAQA